MSRKNAVPGKQGRYVMEDAAVATTTGIAGAVIIVLLGEGINPAPLISLVPQLPVKAPVILYIAKKNNIKLSKSKAILISSIY